MFNNFKILLLTWVAGVIVSIFLIFCVIYIGNVNIHTADGIWKSVVINKWMADDPSVQLDNNHLLYYPIMAKLVPLIPSLGRLDYTWQKLALINCVFAGFASAGFFLLALGLYNNVTTAFIGTFFHAVCGYVLLESIISDDIIPSYSFFVFSIAIFVWYSRNKDWFTLFLSCQFMSISWLLHSSMALAGICSLLSGVFAMNGTIRERIERTLIAGHFLLLTPFLCGMIFYKPMQELFLSGLHQGTFWGGWTIRKIPYLTSGIGHYLLLGRNLSKINI
ncbi:TPA: hypothetical protein ENS27_01430, partial [bacterium]|nr:hypothetical protein [bacterium]